MKDIQQIILIAVVATIIMRSMRLKICNETFCCYPLSIYQAHIVTLKSIIPKLVDAYCFFNRNLLTSKNLLTGAEKVSMLQ